MAIYEGEAIILKREDRGEADRLYTLFSKEFGKIKAQAQGVRKISAKLTGHLEPFNLIWLEMVTKRSGQIGITSALCQEFLLKRPAPWQVNLAMRCCNLLDKLMVEPERDEGIWNFLLLNLKKLNTLSQKEAQDFFSQFRQELISALGYGVDIEVARRWLGDFDVV